MAEKRFYVNLNLKGQELKNFKLEHISVDVSSAEPNWPSENDMQMFYNTYNGKIYYYSFDEPGTPGPRWRPLTSEGIKDLKVHQDSSDYMTITETGEPGVLEIKLEVEEFADSVNHGDLGDISHDPTDPNYNYTHAEIDDHIDDRDNVHEVTLEQARLAGDTLSGDIDMGENIVTGLKAPIDGTDAVNKAYADAIAAGLKIRSHVQYATTENLAATYATDEAGTPPVYTLTANSNGVLEIDGLNPSVGDRILVKNQDTSSNNGIYIVEDTGSAETSWILERCSEYDNHPELELHAGSYFFVSFGNENSASGWVLKDHNDGDPDFTNGDPIEFTKFTQVVSELYTGGHGIDIVGYEISVDPEAIAGEGLVVSSTPGQLDVNVDNDTIEINTEGQLEVKNYTPVDDTTVVRKKVFENQTIGVGTPGNTFEHGLNDKFVKVTVYDEGEDFEEVEVAVKLLDDDNIEIESNIEFTATVIIEG